MGQKSNPNCLRIGINQNWESKWFSNCKKTPKLIYEDFQIRSLINTNYFKTMISKIEIERLKGKNKELIKINLHVFKNNLILAQNNKMYNEIVKKIEKITQKEIILNIIKVLNPDKVASLVAQNAANQLEQRVYFRRVQKTAIQKVLKTGAKGVKILISGRLGGLEMARSESSFEGRIPLHTLRADIDYAFAEAHTTYGSLGVKVYIFHGEVLPGQTILDTRKPFIFKKNYRTSRNLTKERKNYVNS